MFVIQSKKKLINEIKNIITTDHDHDINTLLLKNLINKHEKFFLHDQHEQIQQAKMILLIS